jgi:hypothetical protein
MTVLPQDNFAPFRPGTVISSMLPLFSSSRPFLYAHRAVPGISFWKRPGPDLWRYAALPSGKAEHFSASSRWGESTRVGHLCISSVEQRSHRGRCLLTNRFFIYSRSNPQSSQNMRAQACHNGSAIPGEKKEGFQIRLPFFIEEIYKAYASAFLCRIQAAGRV